MRIIAIFLTLLFGSFGTPALAQLDTNSFLESQFSINLDPAFPRPGETVTATINDYRGSSYGASITWVLDGEVLAAAENQREATFTAGKVGSTMKLETVLSKPGGTREVYENTITPVYLDVIIEPQTRTPHFYLGRALPSIGSSVNATALISGRGFRNPDLVYTWRLGQQVIGGGAIRGQNQVTFTMPMGQSEVLSLQVADLSGNIVASRSFLIPSVSPEINFYEVSSLFGVSTKVASAGISIIGSSVVIQAEPYYLDSRVYNNPAVATWKLNGISTSNQGGNPYEITLERGGLSGSTELEFHVRDTKQILQGAEAGTRINF